MGIRRFVASIQNGSLAARFVIVGGAFSLAAMFVVGLLVTSLIEGAVTQNTAISTALYVDSIIAPLLPDMQTSETLDTSVGRALDETLKQGPLAERLVTFRLWRRDGLVLYSSDESQTGKQFTPSEDLKAAFEGKVIAQFDEVDDVESATERARNIPLLEVYNPVLQPWSGEVVAVSEFYEDATDFKRTLDDARRLSWAAVAGATALFFVSLSAIVLRGSRTIDVQSAALKDRIQELSDLLDQNEMLRDRVQRASERAASINEMYLRRISADLHDGPAQLIALAALRLDSADVANARTPISKRKDALGRINSILDEALSEIRSICGGLTLPHIDDSDLPTIINSAARAHEDRTGSPVQVSISCENVTLSPSEKICIFRFLQETLHNGFRHGGGVNQIVRQSVLEGRLTIEVEDGGPGFDTSGVRADALGLVGLQERIGGLGGQFFVASSASGTRVTMMLAVGV
jgi:signal transduction histidine kinase